MDIKTLKSWATKECECKIISNRFYFDSKNYLKSPLFRQVITAQGFKFTEKLKNGYLIYTIGND
jgi:hypothetical protein